MIPDRTNYEIWLIDYLDGNLDPRRVEQLMSFLDENPDLKEEFREITQFSIKPGNNSFRHKNSLKKSFSDISESQFEYMCIAAAENDLSDQQAVELEEIMADSPEKRKTYGLIQKLKLIAPELEYRKKSRLRKLTVAARIVRFSAIGLSAAATIAILITLFNPPVNNFEDKFRFATINPTDSNTILVYSVKIAGNRVAEEKKVTKNTSVKRFSSLKKTISDEMKSFNTGSSITYSTSGNPVIQPVLISKIDFRQNLDLGERSFTSTLVAINTQNISLSGTVEKPGFNDFIAKTFREKILKSNDPEKGQLKFYEIADAGIYGLNKLFGWQMSLKKNKDEKGEIKSVYFSSKLLKFNAPVKRAEPLP